MPLGPPWLEDGVQSSVKTAAEMYNIDIAVYTYPDTAYIYIYTHKTCVMATASAADHL